MADDLERLVAEIPAELKDLVDADRRTNREVVEAALWTEFGGRRESAIKRRIDEKSKRIEQTEKERKNRLTELEKLKDERDALEAQLETVKEKDAKDHRELQDALNKIKDAPRDPENPAVKRQAERVGMEPQELLDELPDDNGMTGMSSL